MNIHRDEQSELFAFVVLDTTSTSFRFGYCRRSNREATCLCIIRYEIYFGFRTVKYLVCSYYPWFEIFYQILNDLAQIINAKSVRIFLFYIERYIYIHMQLNDSSQSSGLVGVCCYLSLF